MANENVDLYLDGVANFAVCTVGLGINAAAIGMLCRQNTSSLFVKLMISLVTYDLIYVFLSATCYSLPRLSTPFKDHVFVYLAPFLVPITQMALAGSVYTTVAVTVERYISVVVPFFRQRHNLKAWVFIVPVAIFVIAYSIPRFFELETEYIQLEKCSNETSDVNSTAASDYEWSNASMASVNTSSCVREWVPNIKVTDLRFNPYYVSIYALYLNLIVNICLPLTLLVAMNICIYRTMRNQWYRNNSANRGSSRTPAGSRRIVHFLSKRQSTRTSEAAVTAAAATAASASQQEQQLGQQTNNSTPIRMRRVGGLNEAEYKKRDAKYTRASVVMVVAFVVCNTPRFVPNIMEIIVGQNDFPTWGYVLISVNQLLTVINSAFNFLIYWSFCCTHRRRKHRANNGTTLSMKAFQRSSFVDSSRPSRHTISGHHQSTSPLPSLVAVDDNPLSVGEAAAPTRSRPHSGGLITMPVTTKNRAARERCEQAIELEAFIVH